MTGIFDGGDRADVQRTFQEQSIEFGRCSLDEVEVEDSPACYEAVVDGEAVEKLDMSGSRPADRR